MATLEDVDLNSLFYMFKGEPGTRKSTQALSFPRPQFWISTDMKMEALTIPMRLWGIPPREVEYEDYNNWSAPEAKLKSLQLNCKYKTIMVDSITSIGDSINKQTRGIKKDDNKGKVIGGINVNSIEDFNAESAAFADMMFLLKDIKKFHRINIVLIAHVIGQRKDDSANKLTHHSRIIVTGSDKIGSKIASYAHEAYHFNIENSFDVDTGAGNYALITEHTGNDFARTSLGLDKKIVFNSNPIYPTYIKPAIDKLMVKTPSAPVQPVSFSAK